MSFVELSRTLAQGMKGIRPGYEMTVRPAIERKPGHDSDTGPASFEISQVAFTAPVGTYIDSPRTRDAAGRDIASIGIEELVLPGLCLDMQGHGARAHAPVLPDELPPAAEIRGRAVLFDFGRAHAYGTPAYDEAPPYLPRETVEALIGAGARLVGVDGRSPDDPGDPTRPAHTLLLRAEIFIVENLVGLDALHGRRFRFFAVPLKVKDATSFPIRAFAEVEG